MNSNTVIETAEDIPLTPEAEATGVLTDRIVRMGWKRSRAKFDRPVRLVEVHVPARPPRGLGRVSAEWELVCLAYNMKRLFRLQTA